MNYAEILGWSFSIFTYTHIKQFLQNITLAPIKVNKTSKEEAEKTAMVYLEKVGIPEKAGVYPSSIIRWTTAKGGDC